MKYTAVKLKYHPYWIWFQMDKVKIDRHNFLIGNDGWGKGGAKTNINVNCKIIEGQIWSDELQYNEPNL